MGNPVWQRSAFQVSVGELRPLALLAVGLEAVARRLRLLVEESWDGGGALRVAFFVLDETDYAVTCREGDVAGTSVWVRRSGPVDPAERVGALVAVLGVGLEVVSFANWGGNGEWSPGYPESWRRRWDGAVISRQEFWESFRKRPGMYVGSARFDMVTRFLAGYDLALGGTVLAGFKDWLVARVGTGSNLTWEGVALHWLVPGGRPPVPWPREDEERVVAQLLELIDEFFREVAAGRYEPQQRANEKRDCG